MLGSVQNRRDDADVPGATADVAGNDVSHPVSSGRGLLRKEGMRGRQHAGCTEAALQRVVRLKRLLQG